LANVKKIFSSETARPNGAKLGRKHLCKILYKTSSFGSIRPTKWLLLLKIEHIVKLHVFGNNSKTVNNIRNLTGVKMISTARSNYPENLITFLGVIALFSSNFQNFNTFHFLFKKKYKR
jgi:hypothetical protein